MSPAGRSGPPSRAWLGAGLGLVGLTGVLLAITAGREVVTPGPGDGSSPAAPPAADLSTAAATQARGASVGVGGQAPATHPEAPAIVTLDCAAPRGVVARVDGRAIEAGTVCAWLEQLGGDLRGAPALIDLLVEMDLVRAALDAASQDVPDDAVAARLASLRPRAGAAIAPELLRAQLHHRMRLEALVRLDGDLGTSEAEVDAALDAERADPRTRTRARIEGWLARVPAGAPPEVVERARADAGRFVEAARASAAASGEGLGLSRIASFELTATGMEPELEGVAYDLAPGAWSDPIRTRAGWSVIRRVALVDVPAPPEHEARARVRRELEARRALAEERRLVAALRGDAAVVVSVQR